MTIRHTALALLFTCLCSGFAAAEGQRVMLVLDASGSMRGKINGTTKMDIAKQVVGKVLSTWQADDDLGLVVYGHRDKNSCADIETVWPAKPLTTDAYMSPVLALVPKGKTPMTQAVRQAAEALKYTEQKGTVILVSDGVETCDADPCAVARELEQAGIGLTVHTVGFGLDDKKAVKQLKCMAEETGGISILAGNSAELEAALKQTVEAKVELAPPSPPDPVATKDFKGHVYMAEGVELPARFNESVVWVFSTDADGAPGEYIQTTYKNIAEDDLLKAGKLIAKVETDMTSVLVPFEHVDGALSDLKVVLNAGIVEFQGYMDESHELPADGPVWTFSRAADGAYVGTSYGGKVRNLLPAGDYKAKLELGQAKSETAFSVVAGKTAQESLSLGAGVVNVHVTYDGQQPVADGTTIELRKAPDISGAMEHIGTEYGNDRQFKASAGDYVLVVTNQLAKTETPVKIASGAASDVVINLQAGVLAVKASGATAIRIMSKADLAGNREQLGFEYKDELNYPATAGEYYVVAMGANDAILAEKTVVVEVGKRLEVTLP